MEDVRLVENLTQDELAEAQRMHDVMMKAIEKDVWQLAKFMATRRDDQLFGETEFTVRDKALRMGAQALQATVDDRKKRATQAAAPFVPIVAKTPDFSAGGRGRS